MLVWAMIFPQHQCSCQSFHQPNLASWIVPVSSSTPESLVKTPTKTLRSRRSLAMLAIFLSKPFINHFHGPCHRLQCCFLWKQLNSPAISKITMDWARRLWWRHRTWQRERRPKSWLVVLVWQMVTLSAWMLWIRRCGHALRSILRLALLDTCLLWVHNRALEDTTFKALAMR